MKNSIFKLSIETYKIKINTQHDYETFNSSNKQRLVKAIRLTNELILSCTQLDGSL